jgi:hypothetical protein
VVFAPLPGGPSNKRGGQPTDSAVTQTAPKFGPRLRRRGQRDQNALGRCAGFFQPPVKIGLIRMSDVRLRRAIGDALTL